ncbi:MAG: hypothetical protein LBH30_03865 [Prevotellaceae bacterium]|nr:hypothetical protein [Prevotellaceae bacterium]
MQWISNPDFIRHCSVSQSRHWIASSFASLTLAMTLCGCYGLLFAMTIPVS